MDAVNDMPPIYKNKRKNPILSRIRNAMHRAPRVLHSPEDGGGGGGGGSGGGGGDAEPPPADAPKFTQADFDKQIGKRIGEVETRVTKKLTEAHQAKVSEYEAKIAELTQQVEDSGKTAEQRERNAELRAQKQREKELADLRTAHEAEQKKAAAALDRLRTREISLQLGNALDGAKVLTSARADAIEILMAKAKIEVDEDYQVTSVVYEGTEYGTLAEAAAAFLKTKPHYLSVGVPPNRQDQKPPNRGGTSQTADVLKRSAGENFGAAFREK
jgi:hypothetical protein